MVEGISWTYCDQCRCCTTGTKEHSITTNIYIVVPLENPRWSNNPAAPTEAPAPHAGVLAQAGPANNTIRGVNPKSIMAADLGGDPHIGGNSVYYGGSLSLMDHIFIGCVVTYESEPPTSNDVDVGAPDFCSDELLFSNEFSNKLDAD